MTISEKVRVDQQDIEDEEETFNCMGSWVHTKACQAARKKPIKAGLGKEWVAYNELDKMWKNTQFTSKIMIKSFKSNVISVSLYEQAGCVLRY